jgi:hypothetical protein
MGAEMFHADGRTGGHDEAESHFLQFCECARSGEYRGCETTITPLLATDSCTDKAAE